MPYSPNISEEKIRETTCQYFGRDRDLDIKILTNYIGDGKVEEMDRKTSPKTGKKLKTKEKTVDE